MRVWHRVTVGFADDVPSTDDDHMCSIQLDTVSEQELHHAVRCAGQVGFLTDDESADVDGGEAIDVLIGGDGGDDTVLVDMRWQWQLNEDTMYGRILVQFVDKGNELFFGRVCWQTVVEGVDTDIRTRLFLCSDV